MSSHSHALDLCIFASLFPGGPCLTTASGVYNATNTDGVTTYNQTFVPHGPWLTPTGIQPGRYAKVSAQIDARNEKPIAGAQPASSSRSSTPRAYSWLALASARRGLRATVGSLVLCS